ncbi:MAG: CPBP family intramembrane metalloprotease [Sphingomonas bacterium]|nr:CPBP family intramembrane metalloprotease [Sphingomonas bacterium]
MQDVMVESTALRPLWKRIADFPLVSMLLAVALFIGATALVTLIARLLPPMDKLAATAIKSALAILVVTLVYKLAIRKLGDEPRDDLPAAGAAKGLGFGLLFGFILFSLVVGVAGLLDVYNIVGEGGIAALWSSLIVMAIMPAFMEELLFRGILFRHLEAFGGSWFALALTSALFGLGHIMNPNATALSSFAIAIEAGILLGGAYMLTRSLWMPMGLHAAWNFTQGGIFDVPVSGIDQQGLVTAKLSGPELLSGGSFGLEASLIAMVLATAAGVWLVVLAVRRGHVVRPWWVRRRLAAEPALDPAQVTG